MTRDELIAQAVGAGLEWSEGEHEGAPGLFIHWSIGGRTDGEVVHVADAMLAGLDWDTVRRFVYDGRNVTRMTRIVGYYSRVENWNKSKLGELADRQKGSYGTDGKAEGETHGLT